MSGDYGRGYAWRTGAGGPVPEMIRGGDCFYDRRGPVRGSARTDVRSGGTTHGGGY